MLLCAFGIILEVSFLYYPTQITITHLALAAVVRDTLYIDGGYLWWLPGLASGLDGIPTQDGMTPGDILQKLANLTWVP